MVYVRSLGAECTTEDMADVVPPPDPPRRDFWSVPDDRMLELIVECGNARNEEGGLLNKRKTLPKGFTPSTTRRKTVMMSRPDSADSRNSSKNAPRSEPNGKVTLDAIFAGWSPRLRHIANEIESEPLGSEQPSLLDELDQLDDRL